MALRVQKFGGSSVASIEAMRQAASRVLEARRAGDRVVVVVSARAGTTDALLEEARGAVPAGPPESPAGAARSAAAAGAATQDDGERRELDALLATGEQSSAALMALLLCRSGCAARSLSGWQAGIVTDGRHGAARVLAVAPERLESLLAEGITPVVAGFQGITAAGDVTTLGRGGSDATAVVLAAALSADACEIYSDVDGVYSADPRVVPNAHRIERIAYEEMLEMARLGAKVLQHRAVEYARDLGVVLRARSTFAPGEGTEVGSGGAERRREAPVPGDRPVGPAEGSPVTAVNLERGTARIAVSRLPAPGDAAARLFEALATAGVNVDMIVLTPPRDGAVDASFTVAEADRRTAEEVVRTFARDANRGGIGIDVATGLCKLSAVGAGMATRPGVASAIFRAIAESGATVELVGTSEISVTCLLRSDRADEAARRVHAEFFPT